MRFTLREFGEQQVYLGLEPGAYEVAYHDTTHMAENSWLQLLEIEIERAAWINNEADGSEAFFTLTARLDINAMDKAHGRQVADCLALSFARLGLTEPALPNNSFEDLAYLTNEKSVVLLPDSNSLGNGTLHWLLRSLKGSAWILPFVLSLTQIQERDAALKGMVGKRDKKHAVGALRARGRIYSSLGLLERYKSQYQVLELDPALLRYMRQTANTDDGNVLEDRLLLEGVHAVLKTTRTRAQQRVITSDVLLARMLEAEGVKCLYIPSPTLTEGPYDCLTFNTFSGKFCGSSLRCLLWDLAHVFSTVRLSKKDRHYFSLSAYWAMKSPDDWRHERLVAEISPPGLLGLPAPTPERGRSAVSEKAATSTSFSQAYLPQASLPQILRLVGAAMLYAEPVDLTTIIAQLPEGEKPLVGSARRALEVARRIGLIEINTRGMVLATSEARTADTDLQEGNLDRLAQIFMRFSPYQTLMDAIDTLGSVERNEAEDILRSGNDAEVAKEASLRLTRYHVLLGQTWTDGTRLHNGSRRPDAKSFSNGFAAVFARHESDGLARVADMVPDLCAELQMSGWALNRQLNEAVAGTGLSAFTFQSAAGLKPSSRDKVLMGRFDRITEVAIPTDRFELGGRPIFTVLRTSR